ncbi:RraA family protein [Candidatus Enterococcus ferrettii]|uniref:Putative 4-hydroxy-4-methyl-2-oxoglutarate aldolase n=1 Tax=Candidatus Enterococcus ferrettii TaxID=2815324 RepID=A0ABV0EUG6_9ENTE|nr:RraA family protein [Enterococcus sp. 665A]MBO1339413.1 RraA family protein [Enterococcus sp. 665A]
MSIGNRVFLKRHQADPKLVERFGKLPTADVADCLSRTSALSPEIRLQSSPEKYMCGVALTVKARAGDNLMLHQAMKMAQEGDVIILSNEGDRSRALMGEIMYKYLADYKKVAGIVIDGPIRDLDVLAREKCPIYATASTPQASYKEGPGEVNGPISVGGITVMPGDIVLGDRDGVVIIPKKDAAQIIDQAEAITTNDREKVQKASVGNIDHSWLTKTLEEKHVEFIDEEFSL